MKLKVSYFFIIIFIIFLFLNYNLVLTSSLEATDLWLKKVFPYLFMMLSLSDILISLNFDKIFKTTTPFIIFTSILSGAPSNAFILANLKKNKKITKNEANTYLLFTYFANPLFMYTIFNTLFNKYITFKLILIHYLANLFIYLLNYKKLKNKNINSNIKPTFNLASSIKKSINTLTFILGTMTFFLVLTNILSKTFNLNPFLTLFLKGIFEVTQGLNYLIPLKISTKIKEIIAISFISFGGLSIHTQVKCLLDEENLDYSFFFKGRILQVLFSVILTTIT